MQTIIYNISQVIGTAIIHSLWQGLFIYLGLRLMVLIFPNLTSATKHNAAITALAAITIWFAHTLLTEFNTHTWIAIPANNKNILPLAFNVPLHIANNAPFSTRYNYTIEWLLPYITIVYMAGLIFNTGQLVWARKKINNIRKTMSIDVQLQLKVDQFVNMLNIKDKVRFGLTRLVDAPCMMGYFKPVILLPFTLSAYLSAEEIEIIILHELAHIKRNDYLVNMVQQAMSVLLFFNPFAQLINRIINLERENSCDDIVIEATNKPLVYAHALLKLEQTRQQQWQLALAATGKKYHLLNRIERIMKTRKPIGNARHIVLAMVLLIASITGLAWLNPTIANGKISFNKIKPAIISEMFADTGKRKVTVYHHKLASAHKQTATAKRSSKTYYNDDEDFNDAELNKLSAAVGKYGDEIGKYYNNPDFKKLTEEMQQKGKEMSDFYNKPELKELNEKMQQLSANFNKNWGDNSDANKLGGRMSELGSEVGKYYSTPEFKKLNSELETKYGIPHDRNYSKGDDFYESDNYKKYQEELRSHISPAEKEREDELKKLGQQMRHHYDSPEMRKAQEEMRAMGDSMRKAYHNPNMEKEKEDMRKLGEQMRAYQNSPDIRKIKEQMQVAQRKLNAYMNSPEFKARMMQWKAMNFDYHYDYDTPEKPEKPEKPEIEKPEINKPQAPEKPEAPEKPDTSDKQ